ncbi:hypothetical protein LSG31_19285 [Fodinisporobacter ferrooxydans]|uniref:DUF4314 domain-containing protein n=1 Tax=Fodinisporobacter ferrooxydans TaxID=2901836 RepID=A0ABY4CKJ6_9BACL|nr:hypothetical protein LSG31_19285 [Alicyclobacillaceae bacterium MYW30-H2]
MRLKTGDCVEHPQTKKKGYIIQIFQNPACFIRTLVIRWEDGEIEELEELEFGPLDDE